MTTPKKYPTKSLRALLDGPVTINWLVEGIVPPGTAGLVAGNAGVGKSWLSLALSLAIATGSPWLGRFPCRRGRVLIVDEENADLLLRIRLHAMLAGLGIADVPTRPAGHYPIEFLVGAGVNLSPVKKSSGEVTVSPGYLRLLETVKSFKPSLIVFDSLTRVHSANESAANEMAAVFANVRRLINDTGVAVVFTHHTRKGGGTNGDRIRGSTDIRAFADYALLVDATKDGAKITHDKSRWAKPVDPFAVRFDATADSFALTYAGEAKDGADAWGWLKERLTRGDADRETLVRDASAIGLCGQRKLDSTLKWAVDEGLLSKHAQGRRAVYRLEIIEPPVTARGTTLPLHSTASLWEAIHANGR